MMTAATKRVTCLECAGEGLVEVGCPVCNGTGEAYSSMTPVGPCRGGCGGNGVVTETCEECNGDGEIEAAAVAAERRRAER